MTRPGLLFAGVAAVVFAAHLATDAATEPFFNNDETRHVMTGIFVRDALRDMPASAADPKGYAVRYYAQYPALGLLVWPPFFYAVEGAAMSVGGTSFVTARVVVSLFGLLAGWYAFRLSVRSHGPWLAAFAAGLLGFAPLVYEYARRVMLEVPTLAVALAAVFHFERYRDETRPRDAVLACLFAAFAALTRFDGVLLLPYFFLRVAVGRRWALLLRRPVVLGVALALALTVPYYLFTWQVYGGAITKAAGEGTYDGASTFLGAANLSYYPACVPGQIGWPAAVAAGVGLLATVVVPSRRAALGPAVALLVATYVTFTPMAELEPRHAIYWLPAVAVFAAEGVRWLSTGTGVKVGVAAALCVFGATAWGAVSRPMWWVSGYDDAARFVAERASGDRPVLMDGALNGSFIYHVRRADPARRLWVLRGDKLFYAMMSDPHASLTELTGTEAEVLAVIDRYDPEWIVVEQPHLIFDVRGAELLRDVLRGHPERFRLEGTVPLRSNHVRRFGDARLEAYHKLDRSAHPLHAVEVPVLGLGKTLRAER